MVQNDKTKMKNEAYKEVLRKLPVSYILIDSKHIIRDCNDIFCALSAFDREELLNRSIFDFKEGYSEETLKEILKETIENTTAERRLDVHNKLGIVFHVDVKTQTIELEDETYVAILIYNSTQEEELIKQLRLRNSIFLELIDNSHRGLYIEDTCGIITYINFKLLRFLGLPPIQEEFVGKHRDSLLNIVLAQLIEPDRFMGFVHNGINNQNGIVDFDVELHNGRTFRMAYEPVYHEGKLAAHLWFFNDITTEIAATKEVEEQKHFYDQIIREMPVESVIVSTGNFSLMHINDLAVKNQKLSSWEKGMPLESLIASSFQGSMKVILSEKAERFRSCAESRSALQFIDVVNDSDGSLHYYKRFVTPYFKGEELHMISEFSVDLTDIKLVEQELSETQVQLLSLIESEKAHIWSVDRNKRFVNSNQTFKNVLLKSFGIEMYQGYYMPDSFESAEMSKEWSEFYDRVLSGEVFSVTRTFPLPFEGFTMEYTFKPIFNDRLEVVGASVFGYDLTELTHMQDELHEVHSNLRSLIETSRAMIWSVDDDLNITYANKHFKEKVLDKNGNSLDEGKSILLSKTNNNEIHYWRIQYKRALEGESFLIPDVDYKGEVYEYSFKPIHDNKNKIIGVSVIAFNISALVGARKLLEQSEANLKALVSSLDDIVFELDVNGRVINVWTSNEKLLYVPKNKLVGAIITDFELPIQGVSLVEILKKAKEEAITSTFDYLLGDICYQAKVSPIINLGFVTGISILVKDITEKKKQENLLLESEAKFRLISEQMIDMVFVTDLSGTFTYLTPSTRQMLGYEPDELTGTSFFEIVTLDDIELANKAFGSITNESPTAIIELRIKRKDGSLIYVESKIKLVTENPENPVLQVVTRDISERKMAEESIQKNLEKEKELILMKSRLVSTVSHEFKTPMSTIRSSAELIDLYLQKDPKKFSEKISTHIQIITDEIDRINKLMNDVLLLMKEDANASGPKQEVIDLSALCNKIINTNFAEIQGHSRVIMSDEIAPAQIIADPIQITYALFNLISNATKYSEESKPVHLKISEEDDEVVIKISDEGIGIPEQDIPYLFTSFFRASNTEKFPGTGLGLVIVKTFIEKNGGRIEISSKLNKGTTATIRLKRFNKEVKK